MSDIKHRTGKRGAPAPPEVRAAVAALAEQYGPREAGRRLGISRDQVVGIAAGIPVLNSTVALAQVGLERNGTSSLGGSDAA